MKLFFFTTFSVLILVSAREFSTCELVRQLRHHGFPESKMRDWVCLIEKESGRRNDAIGMMNADGSWDHGLFQINDRYWCNRSNWPSKECHVTCDQLRREDIGPAARCAKLIFARHGFSAWYAWRDHCQSSLPQIGHC
ncbi:lysozyme-like [Pieris napi]|uniref:lysozyme-like n=1 Tax=Pieris napi TaxID=78633 RepID=UPI001FBAA6D4|nr:lysozyme-like [Pieris napi]